MWCTPLTGSSSSYFNCRLLPSSLCVFYSVSDPNPEPIPDPPDPHLFGPPGSGSRSFYHQAKIVRKTLIPTVLWLVLDFLSLKNWIRGSGYGFTPKCHGSGTLVFCKLTWMCTLCSSSLSHLELSSMSLPLCLERNFVLSPVLTLAVSICQL